MSITLGDVDGVQVSIPTPPVVYAAAPAPPSVTVVPIAPSGEASALEALTHTAIAAVALSGHRVVTPNTAGQLVYADPTNLAHVGVPLWVTTGAVLAGGTATVVTAGVLEEPTWAWTPGPVWLGLAGVLTQVRPARPAVAFLAAVGAASSPTGLAVARQPSIVLS